MHRKILPCFLKYFVLIWITVLIVISAADLSAQAEDTGFSVSGGISSFRLGSVVPRILIPGTGDLIRFSFNNPDYSEVRIRIFNIAGRLIRKNLPREQENIMYWDGTDDDNHAARSGIYIYQVEVGGNIVNGTIVIAQ